MARQGSVETRVDAFMQLRGITMSRGQALQMFQEREALEDVSQMLSMRGLDATLDWDGLGESLILKVWLPQELWEFKFYEGELVFRGFVDRIPRIPLPDGRFVGVTGAADVTTIAALIQGTLKDYGGKTVA